MSEQKTETRWLSPAFAVASLGAPGWYQEVLNAQMREEQAQALFVNALGALSPETIQTAVDEMRRRSEVMGKVDALESVVQDITSGRFR